MAETERLTLEYVGGDSRPQSLDIIEFSEDNVVLRSLRSGRLWGVSLDVVGGQEEVTVTELEPEAESPPNTDQ